MIPWLSRAASELTPATTRGTSSCIRQKLVLSITREPASTNRGAHSSLTAPPAEEIRMSIPWIESSSGTRTWAIELARTTDLPRDRSEAKGTISDAGKARSSSRSRTTEPTAPVAPRTPTTRPPEPPPSALMAGRSGGVRRSGLRGRSRRPPAQRPRGGRRPHRAPGRPGSRRRS